MSEGIRIIEDFIRDFIEAVCMDRDSIKIEIQERPDPARNRTVTVFTVWGTSRRDASILIGFRGFNISALRYLTDRIASRQNVGPVRVEIRDPDGAYDVISERESTRSTRRPRRQKEMSA